jgi:hypothetical protein
VSEGNNETEYSKFYLPASFASTECEKLVMTLIKFEPVDVSKIPIPLPKTKEERADEISKTIVDLTPVARPIHVSYRIELEQLTNNTGPLTAPTIATIVAPTGLLIVIWGRATLLYFFHEMICSCDDLAFLKMYG